MYRILIGFGLVLLGVAVNPVFGQVDALHAWERGVSAAQHMSLVHLKTNNPETLVSELKNVWKSITDRSDRNKQCTFVNPTHKRDLKDKSAFYSVGVIKSPEGSSSTQPSQAECENLLKTALANIKESNKSSFEFAIGKNPFEDLLAPVDPINVVTLGLAGKQVVSPMAESSNHAATSGN